jgi:hypothetical protein
MRIANRCLTFGICSLLLIELSITAQETQAPGATITNSKWGPWMTHPGHPGIKSRAKCQYTITSDHTSMWAFEFRNDYPYAIDYIFAEEGAGRAGNSMNTPGQFSLDSGQISPAMNTTLHGSCKELSGLTVDVRCAVPKGQVDRCYTQYHLPRPTSTDSAKAVAASQSVTAPAMPSPTPKPATPQIPSYPFGGSKQPAFLMSNVVIV